MAKIDVIRRATAPAAANHAWTVAERVGAIGPPGQMFSA